MEKLLLHGLLGCACRMQANIIGNMAGIVRLEAEGGTFRGSKKNNYITAFPCWAGVSNGCLYLCVAACI
jgi:hypothetical protein